MCFEKYNGVGGIGRQAFTIIIIIIIIIIITIVIIILLLIIITIIIIITMSYLDRELANSFVM